MYIPLKKYKTILYLALISLPSTQAISSSITNGGFETGDYTDWNNIGTYRSIDTTRFGVNPTEGSYMAHISAACSCDATQAAIESGLGLASNDLDALISGNAIDGNVIYQTISVNAGDTFSFDYNFNTQASVISSYGYNDFSLLAIDGESILLASALGSTFLPTTHSNWVQTGWFTYNHLFQSSGDVIIGMGTINEGSGGYTSYTLFDNIAVSAVPVPAAIWLFGSGLLCLIGAARRKNT